nr:MAG TPA: hypothetical protein [Caudoviricetes sp.]
MKQHESLTILPSPTISRSGRCFTSLLNVHPNLSPFGFMRCGCFAEYLAFLFSIILPIPPLFYNIVERQNEQRNLNITLPNNVYYIVNNIISDTN